VFSVAAPVAAPARAVVVEGATLPPAPPAATVPGPENVGRLIESMRVQMRQGVQEATVRLNPEHLGEVTISVRVERGAVSAVVNAETPAVQQWLESQEDKLRSGLSDQGLHLAKFIVQRDGSQQHREQPQQPKQPAPRDRQHHDGTPIRFEVLV
jgi:flagellar hook-length control protein FliK